MIVRELVTFKYQGELKEMRFVLRILHDKNFCTIKRGGDKKIMVSFLLTSFNLGDQFIGKKVLYHIIQ